VNVKCPHCGRVLGIPDGAQGAQGKCAHCQQSFEIAKAERVGLNPGDMLGGCRVEAVLGRGGMAVVYRATQVSLNRPVALKVLAPHLARRKDFVERFDREAAALAQLTHPNIVGIVDKGVEGDTYFFAMEFVEGESLRARLRREGKLPLEQAAQLIGQVAAGLEYAHARGILHRDIKPENILITAEGVPKLADFGIARMVGADAPAQQRLTLARTQMGSAHYMAPEQMHDAASADHRADIYALGVLLYETLTGQLPIGQFEPASRLVPGTPAAVDRLIAATLAASPEKRLQTVAQFRSMLERAAMPGVPTLIQERPPVRSAARKKSRAVPIAMGAALALAAAIVLFALLSGNRGTPPTQGKAVPALSTAGQASRGTSEAEKREKAAEDLFNLAARQAGLDQWTPAKEALARLEAEFSDTRFGASNRTSIAALRTKIDARLKPPEPPTPKETPKAEPKGVAPVDRAAEKGFAPGLVTAFYRGEGFTEFLRATAADAVCYDWAMRAPAEGVPERFSARFVGWLWVERSAPYEVGFWADDGARLYLDGRLAVDGWQWSDRERRATIPLEAGWHRLWVDYVNRGEMAGIKLRWNASGQWADISPAACFCERDLLDRARREPTQDPLAGLTPPGQPAVAAAAGGFFHGAVRLLPDGRVELRYEFANPEHLRDWPEWVKNPPKIVGGEARIGPGFGVGGANVATFAGDIEVEGTWCLREAVGPEASCGLNLCAPLGRFYGIVLRAGNQKIIKDSGVNVIGWGTGQPTNGEPHAVRCVRAGKTLKVWIDGELRMDSTDPDHTRYAVGVGAWNARVGYKDMRIVGRLDPEWLEAHAGAAKQLAGLQAADDEKNRPEKSRELYAKGAEGLHPLWAKRQYAEAAAKAKALAAQKNYGRFPAAAKWLAEDAQALLDFWQSVEAGAATIKPGETIRVSGMAGEFEKFEGGAIVIRQGNVGLGKKLTDLTDDELASLARKAGGPKNGRDHLAYALFWLHAAKPAIGKAQAELALAEKDGVDVSRYAVPEPAGTPKPEPTATEKPETTPGPRKAEPKGCVLKIAVTVDGAADLVIVPGAVHWENQTALRPGSMAVNGTAWSPTWNVMVSDRLPVPELPKSFAGLDCVVTKGKGPGPVSLLSSSPQKLVVRFDDDAVPGASPYEAEIFIGALPPFEKAIHVAQQAIEAGDAALLKKAVRRALDLKPKDEEKQAPLSQLSDAVMKRTLAACKAAEFEKIRDLLDSAQALRAKDPDLPKLSQWLKAASTPVFVETFQGGLGNWEVESGPWKIEKGKLSCQVGSQDCFAFLKTPRPKDFVLTCDLMNGARNVGFRLGVLFHHTPKRHIGFVLHVQHHGIGADASKGAEGITITQPPGSKPPRMESDREYRIAIRCLGNDFECYADGELVSRGTDEKPEAGRIGLHAHRADALFSNLRLYKAVPLPELNFQPKAAEAGKP